MSTADPGPDPTTPPGPPPEPKPEPKLTPEPNLESVVILLESLLYAANEDNLAEYTRIRHELTEAGYLVSLSKHRPTPQHKVIQAPM